MYVCLLLLNIRFSHFFNLLKRTVCTLYGYFLHLLQPASLATFVHYLLTFLALAVLCFLHLGFLLSFPFVQFWLAFSLLRNFNARFCLANWLFAARLCFL